MGLQQIIPSPARSQAIASGIEFVFNVPTQESRTAVRFVVKPNHVGPVRLEIRQGDAHLAWTQVVLP